jgi:hypothetical protein
MAALDHLPEIPLRAEAAEGLRFGRAPQWGGTFLENPLTCSPETAVRLTFESKLVAVAVLVPGRGEHAAIVLKRVLI